MPPTRKSERKATARADERALFAGDGLKGDPGRRLRIVEAVIQVVADKGIEGVTHRAVADAAGLPLGSTTYYFKDKDEFIVAAMALIAQRAVVRMRALLEGYTAQGMDVVETLAHLTEELDVRSLDQLVVEYRFSMAPLNRVDLQKASIETQSKWYDVLRTYLAAHVDPTAVDALMYAFEGISIRVVTQGYRPTAEEIAPVYRRIVKSGPKR